MNSKYKWRVVAKTGKRQNCYSFKEKESAIDSFAALCKQSMGGNGVSAVGLFDIEKGDELVAKFDNLRG